MVYFSAEVYLYFFYSGDQNGIDSFSHLKYCCFSAEEMGTACSNRPWAELLPGGSAQPGVFSPLHLMRLLHPAETTASHSWARLVK